MPHNFSPGGRASSPQGLHHETSPQMTACALLREPSRADASIFCLLVSYR